MSDGVPRHEVGRQLVDDGGDHRIEVGDLVVQLEIAAGQGLQADPVGGLHVAIAPSGPAARPPAFGRAACGSCGAAPLASSPARTRWCSGSSAGRCAAPPPRSSGRRSRRAMPRSSRPGFSGVTVRMPAKAACAAFWASKSSFLPRRRRSCLSGVVTSSTVDPGLLQEAQEPGAIAAGRLDADALDLAEGAHPGEHLPIALAGGGEAIASPAHGPARRQRPRHAGLCGCPRRRRCGELRLLRASHDEPPGSTVIDGFAKTDCMDRTVT